MINRQRAALLALLVLPSRMVIAEGTNPVMDPLSVNSMLQVILGLAAVLAIFGGIIFLLKRFSTIRPGSEGKLKVIDGLSVGGRDRVVLLQVGDSQVLLGLTPGRIQPLHVMGKCGNKVMDSEFAKQLETSMDDSMQRAGEKR